MLPSSAPQRSLAAATMIGTSVVVRRLFISLRHLVPRYSSLASMIKSRPAPAMQPPRLADRASQQPPKAPSATKPFFLSAARCPIETSISLKAQACSPRQSDAGIPEDSDLEEISRMTWHANKVARSRSPGLVSQAASEWLSARLFGETLVSRLVDTVSMGAVKEAASSVEGH